jgi:adenylate kinase family enzyme
METQTFVFFGIIGSGKGTQVERLMEYLKSKDSKESLCIGTGEEFRKLVSSENYTANMVKEKMLKGELIPDFLTTSLFTNVLINSLNENKHLFTDGYPRTVRQSESLSAMMKFFKRDKVKIIYIKISEEEAVKRNLLRARHDDTEDGIAKRIEEYKNNVIPAMDYFKGKEGYEIYTINGEQNREDVFKDIIKALNF